MKKYTFYLVDAFTQTPFTGNPCAVVPQAEGLTDKEMACIAKETNAPETAFVLPSTKADVRVRYFMPRCEIPFAGHPTIATAYLLQELGILQADREAQFEFAIGVLPVNITKKSVIMSQPPAIPDQCVPHDDMAEALGLGKEQLLQHVPCQLMKGGVSFLLVPAVNHAALCAMQMDRPRLKGILDKLGVSAAYVFAPEGLAENANFHARLMDPSNPGEDPYTGSAAGCLASYVHAHKLYAGKSFILEQGHILERPGTGRLELVTDSDNTLKTVLLEGQAVVTAKGSFSW